MTRILIADDHEMVRCGVKTLLAGTEIKVVAEATTGQAAAKLAITALNQLIRELRARLGAT